MSKYPVYIISKGRYDTPLTANWFIKDGIEFNIVVEPQEETQYRAKFGDRVLVLPFSNLGKGGTPARNWVWEHAISRGFERHWIFDDNIRCMRHFMKGIRVKCNANIGLETVETFTDRYKNIGMSGFNYTMFVTPKTKVPYYLNTHVYSALLIKNDMPYRWRLRYNEDTDLCLQILTNGLCTVSFNAFSVDKMRTMTMKGGNSDELYVDDGRLKMARTLEATWPGIVETKWRFGRPQHVIKNNWHDFKTPLKRRTDIDWENMAKIDNSRINIKQLKEIKSKDVQKLLKNHKKGSVQ